MRTILIDVDTQHDFCHPQGALFVQGADSLLERFRRLTARGVERGALILGSVDSHGFDAWEFKGAPEKGPGGEAPDFPPHCVKGTAGWPCATPTSPTWADSSRRRNCARSGFMVLVCLNDSSLGLLNSPATHLSPIFLAFFWLNASVQYASSALM